MQLKQVKEFLKTLGGEKGCNFRKDKHNNNIWTCFQNHRFAGKILKEMKISIKEQKEFLKVCKENGGHCDCEILFNAEKALIRYYKNNK